MSNQYTVEKTSTFDGWRQKYNALALAALTDEDIASLRTQYWTESLNSPAPGETIDVFGWSVDESELASGHSGAVAIEPFGDGGFMLQIPDDTAAGGNARGSKAIDLQLERFTPSQVASGDYCAIVGGRANSAGGLYDFIAGGSSNISSNSRSAFLSGESNEIGEVSDVWDSVASAILGGTNNTINAEISVIVGGLLNSIDSTPGERGSGIIAGSQNTINGSVATDVGILFGTSNSVSNASRSAVLGGQGNTITGGSGSAIIGGSSNSLSSFSSSSVILAGDGNLIDATGGNNVILGGTSNGITSTAAGSFVIGSLSSVSANNAYALGVNSTVSHEGSVLWTDSTGTPTNSVGIDEFRLLFNGGVHFDADGENVATIAGNSYEAGGPRLRLYGNGAKISMFSQDGTEYHLSVQNGGTLLIQEANAI